LGYIYVIGGGLMLNHGPLRDIFKQADKIDSEHLILAEWNMNKYYSIDKYGLYVTTTPKATIYDPDDARIMDGYNYLIFEDGTTQLPESHEFFSDLASCFQPNRPDPGIVLLQKYQSMLITPNSSNIKRDNINAVFPRFYPASPTRQYDYFNSSKNLIAEPILDVNLYAWFNNSWFFYGGEIENLPAPIEEWTVRADGLYVHKDSTATIPRRIRYRGVSNANTGNIEHVNPFVVYQNEFPCNKITIKVQNHAAIPDKFDIEVLLNVSGSLTWTTAYSNNLSSSADFTTGIFNIYYDNGSWSKAAPGTPPDQYVLNDFSQLLMPNPTEFKRIQGIRMNVQKLSIVPNPDPTAQSQYNSRQGSLELIEMSPRLLADVTSYTENFSLNSDIGDVTSTGLPVGSLVSGNGQIALNNEDEQFLFSSILNELEMLTIDTEFRFYQLLKNNNQKFAIPLKTMYSTDWAIQEDYSVQVSLEDSMKFLREKNAPDLLFQNESGTYLSIIILFLLDNIGITGLEFKRKETGASSLSQDPRIRSFFCKKEQTVAEVLEQLAIATQCAIYYDAANKLNVLTKERLTSSETSEPSTPFVSGTDFWMVMDENYSLGNSNVSEYPFVSSYNANVISFTEDNINPITNGEINYRVYGPPKVPRIDELPENKLNELTEDFPPTQLSFSNYGYATTLLWEPEGNDSVLGAANVNENIRARRLKNVLTTTYLARDENAATIQAYEEIKDNRAKLQSLIIYLDRNEGFSIAPFEGYILVDSEYIKFRGKLFEINGKRRIIFSEEELKQAIINIPKGGSISLIGLVIDIKFNIVGKQGGRYLYQVVGDGRGKFGSTAAPHFAFNENNSGISPDRRFKFAFGDDQKTLPPGDLKVDVKYNFLDRVSFRGAKREILGRMPRDSLQAYLGFLRLVGPESPASERNIIESLYSASVRPEVARELRAINRATDRKVPGTFDEYVYLDGERRVYGQKINLSFTPNRVSTRMRLFSPRKKLKNNNSIMQTNSSIAGIGFGLNAKNEGYFIEVESVGSGKDLVEKEAVNNNLRFYRVTINKEGKYQPDLLFAAPVGAYTVSNTDVQVIKNENTADPVFEIEVKILKYGEEGIQYKVYYGNNLVGTYLEPFSNISGNVDSNTIFMFVRNDSQAIYEYIAAAARPKGSPRDEAYFLASDELDQRIRSGLIPVNAQFLFTSPDIKYYFNDFARLAREVKVYKPRFQVPAFSSILIDVSRVNPQYYVRKYQPSAFGAEIIVGNSSSGPIILSREYSLPLFITGIALEELSSGVVTVEDAFDRIEEQKRRIFDRDRNKAIYGDQTFNIDSQYIQSLPQARSLMRWILQVCNRQRLRFNMEIFPNPLLELGDKVKIYDKNRGYNQDNPVFGERTFAISSISYTVQSSGPQMNVELIEVGE